MNLNKLIPFIGLVMIGMGAMANDLPSKTKINRSIDLVSKHLWRGYNSGSAPTIEPTLELQTGRFTFGTWGAYAIDDSYQEVDFYLQYNTPLFQFGLYDFYCPRPNFENSDFFDFQSKNSVHLFDALIKYKGSEKFPISVMGSVLFYGKMDKNQESQQQYSTYFELGYSNFIGGKKFSWILGVTPFKGMYDDKMNVVNVNMSMYDSFRISDTFSLPIRTGLTLNPATERLFLTFAVTLR